MRSKWICALLLGALGAATYGGIALATPPSGVTTTVFGVGRFDDIRATTKTDIDPGNGNDFWQSRIDTKGASDVYVLQNTIVPGGTFGWHSHPGPSLVIVRAGMLSGVSGRLSPLFGDNVPPTVTRPTTC